jgi:peroxiredoxin
MKLLRTMVLAAVVIAAAGMHATAADPLSIGAKAPATDVKMKNVDGSMVSIADAMGDKGTLVIFTCNHCPFVKAWQDRIVELGNTFVDKGIGVIAINSNDPGHHAEDGFDHMVERAKKQGMKYPYVVDADSGVAKAFGATRTPEVFLFDGEGKLVYHGTIDDNAQDPEKVDKHYLRDALRAVANGNEVPEATTKAFGCGIKFRS